MVEDVCICAIVLPTQKYYPEETHKCLEVRFSEFRFISEKRSVGIMRKLHQKCWEGISGQRQHDQVTAEGKPANIRSCERAANVAPLLVTTTTKYIYILN